MLDKDDQMKVLLRPAWWPHIQEICFSPLPSLTCPLLHSCLLSTRLHFTCQLFSHIHSTPSLLPLPNCTPLPSPTQPPAPPSPPLSPFVTVFSMFLYQEEKRGSPEGLCFVPAAAYTGLMRSLREGVSVSVYVCVCLNVSVWLWLSLLAVCAWVWACVSGDPYEH